MDRRNLGSMNGGDWGHPCNLITGDPCRNECARKGISSTWCKSMSKEAIDFVAEGNCVAARRGGEVKQSSELFHGGEPTARRITNPIRRGVAASQLVHGEA